MKKYNADLSVIQSEKYKLKYVVALSRIVRNRYGGVDQKLDADGVLKGAVKSVFRGPEKMCHKTI